VALGIGCWKRRWVAAAALVLIAGEAVYNAPRMTRFDRRDSYAGMIAAQADIADFLKAQPGWFRVDFDDQDVPYNFGDYYGIEQFGGAVSSMPLRVHRMLGREETPEIYGIRYRVARNASGGRREEVFASRSGVKVWRDARIGEPVTADAVRVVSRDAERVVLDVERAKAGLVRVGDAFYPGWRARVDGVKRPVQELDSVRAVRVDAGRHRIEMYYRPASVYWGLGITMAGLLAAIMLWRW
jgi:hypothetical protein